MDDLISGPADSRSVSDLVVIFRGLDVEYAVGLAEEALSRGVRILEVTVENPAGLSLLEKLAARFRSRSVVVGAGTVLSPAAVHDALRLGAQFTVSPVFDVGTLRAAQEQGITHIPGVGSVTEAHQAIRAGATWVKAFPASSLGPKWVSAFLGPFPDVRVMASGGLSLESAITFLDAGARLAGVNATHFRTAAGHSDDSEAS